MNSEQPTTAQEEDTINRQPPAASDDDLSCELPVRLSGVLVREILQTHGYKNFRWGDYYSGGGVSHAVLCDDTGGCTTPAISALRAIWERRVASLLRCAESA